HSLLERHLVLGYIAALSSIGSAVYGYTHDFDAQTKMILVVGAGIYFIFTTLTYLQNVFVKKDIVFTGNKTSGLEAERLKVHLATKKYSDQISITYSLELLKSRKTRNIKITRSVGRYFTDKGEFFGGSFMADMQGFVDAYAKKDN
ncbi:hypothetical protein HDU91_000219, partial [Kappamyces sp. JEL0680]